jgi:gliding motility-associated-like protein
VVATIPVGSYPWGIVVSPDGSRVYNTNFNNSTISVINTATNSVIGILAAGPNPYCVAISPDGERLYVTNYYSNRVTVINISTGAVIATINTGTDPRYVTVSPDGSKVYVSNSGSNSISVINTATNTLSNTIAVGTYPEAIVLSLDGSRLYVQNSGSSTVSVINTTTSSIIASIPTSRGGHGAALSRDGTRLYVTNSNLHEVTVINTLTNSVLTTVYAGDFPRSVGNFIIGSSGCNSITFTITVNPTLTPAITPTENLAPLITTYGSQSPSESFLLQGANLTGSTAITAPIGFEVSEDNITFSNSISIASTGTSVATPIYIRIREGIPANTYTGNITMSSPGAPSVNLQVTGVVNPATLSIRILPVSKFYGTALRNNSSSTSFIATGLQNSEVIGSVTMSYGTGASSTSLPGVYSNSVSGSSATGGTFSASNYSITYLPADIIVTAAPLIITADNKTKYLNEPNPPLTVSYSGFVNNEDFSQLTTQPYLNTNATQASPSGQYLIHVSGASSTQYNISYVQGTLTIMTMPSLENIRIPNTFTPNGDGHNDLWEISGIPYDQKCRMKIFEKWGQVVFNANRYQPWDGTFNGKALPVGIYYYIINFGQGNKALSGYITILR